VKPRLLVVSSVHPSDDPRIRHKLIRSLQDDWDVTFAGVGRGPVDQRGIRWIELAGGRLRRSVRAAWYLFGHGYDVASVHDPELLPAAIAASLLGRTVVFDVHENVPAQIRTKEWIPSPLRRPLAWIAGFLLHVAERRMSITLAEAGYVGLFADMHPVFPNYLDGEPPAMRDGDPDIGIVYLGDVTESRGLAVAVEAAGAAGASVFTIMGRCGPEFRARLEHLAAQWDMHLKFHGFVNPEEALRITAGGVMGLSPLLDAPNYWESLPTKVLEYLAVGIPTLASDLAGTRSVIGGKPGAVLVPPGDISAWRNAIRSALDDTELRADARSGARAIRASYVWPREAVRDFYRDRLPA